VTNGSIGYPELLRIDFLLAMRQEQWA